MSVYHNSKDQHNTAALSFDQCLEQAQQGDANAQLQLGVWYAYGHGAVAADGAQALHWWKRAAEQDHAPAQCAMGYAYLYGKHGVSQDSTRAVAWYQLAAMQHQQAHAQYYLGICYQKGWGVQANETLALSWWETAARQGHALAQGKVARRHKRQQKNQKATPKKTTRNVIRIGASLQRQQSHKRPKLVQEMSPTSIKDLVDVDLNRGGEDPDAPFDDLYL